MALTAANADLYLELGINKRHFQSAANTIRFDHGELNLYIRDGIIILAPCTSDPDFYAYGPHLGCPLGITGYVASGDFDRDGVRDDNLYYSIEAIAPAFTLEPSRPDRCSLASAPPSKLPRPLRIFADKAVTAFYDLRRPSQFRQYDLALYEMIRRYGSVRQVETAVAAGAIVQSGQLKVTVTGVDFAAGEVEVDVPIVVELDDDGLPIPIFAEQWAEIVRLALGNDPDVSAFYSVSGTGTSIILTEISPNGNDRTLNIAIEDGVPPTLAPSLPILNSISSVVGVTVGSPQAALKQMNSETVPGRYVFAFPRLDNPDGLPVYMPVTIVPNLEALDLAARYRTGFRFTSGSWHEGHYQMDPRLINTLRWTGNGRESIVPGDQFYFSIMTPSQDRLMFPPTIPQAPVLLPNPAVQSYSLPPSFFFAGDEGVIDLRYQRQLPISAVSFDASKREFRARVRFVDTYAGYAQGGAFPLGSSGDTSPNGDFDRDGMTNIKEYAFQFPTNEQIHDQARRIFVGANDPFFQLGEEFRQVVTKFPEPISDPGLQPQPILDAAGDPPLGYLEPVLDAENHIVYKVPYRALSGNTLKYEFAQQVTGKRGGQTLQKIKLGARSNWETYIEDGPSTSRTVQVQVSLLDPTTREILNIYVKPGTLSVPLTQKLLVLRSKNPVKDPGAPLPVLDVLITPIPLK